MNNEVESFFCGFASSTILWVCMLYFVICPSYQEHAIKCGVASYSATTGELMWHDCAPAPEPAPVPMEDE